MKPQVRAASVHVSRPGLVRAAYSCHRGHVDSRRDRSRSRTSRTPWRNRCKCQRRQVSNSLGAVTRLAVERGVKVYVRRTTSGCHQIADNVVTAKCHIGAVQQVDKSILTSTSCSPCSFLPSRTHMTGPLFVEHGSVMFLPSST